MHNFRVHGICIAVAAGLISGCGDSTSPGTGGGTAGHIVYTSRSATGFRALMLRDVTTGATKTVLSEANIDENDPALSPDGTRIAFSSARDGNPEIYTIGVGGADLRRITNDADQEVEPSWSPDGGKLIFHRSGTASQSLVIVNADGTGETTIPGESGGHPSWSPAGDQIAFESSGGIRIVNVDGSNPHAFDVGVAAYNPAWSPEGSRIAFTCVYESQDICIANADGTNLQNVTNTPTPAGEIDPSWSPDGASLAFTAFRNDNDDVATRKADGTGEKNLTAPSLAEEKDPSWSR